MLENAANAAAQYCLKYNIPVQRLDNDQLKRGERGIIGHVQASKVYKKSSHTDPGTGFPWDYFIERVKKHYLDRVARFRALRPTLTPATVSPPPLIT